MTVIERLKERDPHVAAIIHVEETLDEAIQDFPKKKVIQYGGHWGDVLHHYNLVDVQNWMVKWFGKVKV